MRRAKIPDANNRLFDTIRLLRQLEESAEVVDSYTNGLRIVFSNASERVIPFQLEDLQVEHPESFNISLAHEPIEQMHDSPIYLNSSEVIPEEEKNLEDFPVIKGIENYITVVYRKNQANLTCSICLEDFEEGGEVIRLECFHVFHNHCIRDWANSSGICPECRREI